ncbi:MAG: methylmalonyl Co-A mutase-associated GTPase MeaB [Thermodesulfobacteriota bacterium]
MPDIKEILSGNKFAGARAIRLVEDNDASAFDLLKGLYPHSGKAFIIGITGSPGAGKSTLIDALIKEFRSRDKKVAVLAVDPSSPVSGGAILGDRIRMQRHATDDKVFIRSMASRGQQGGLARAGKDAVIVLDAMGYEIIIIETVGAGQTQFDIKDIAHSTGIVTIPGAGDGIQAVKAGIFETGDIFIVNKIDKPGADESLFQLQNMISMKNTAKDQWEPKVVQTLAQDGTGVKELVDVFLSHLDFMKNNKIFKEKQTKMEKSYFNSLLKDLILEKVLGFIKTSGEYPEILSKIQSGSIDPFSAATLMSDKIVAREI